MKRSLLFLLIPVVLLQIACGLTSRPDAPASATQPPQATSASLPATATPVVEVASESTATPQPASQTATTPPQNQPRLSNQLPPEQDGPETLDLSSPAIFGNPLGDYTDAFSDNISGQDSGGQPTSMLMSLTTRFQGQPAQAWYTIDRLFGPDFTTEKVAVDGKLYTYEEGVCTQATPSEPPQSLFSLLPSVLTGQAQRGEMGIVINGLVTDQYFLTAQNIVPNAEIDFVETTTDGDSTSTSTFTLRIRGSGYLYLARAGGFVVRVELNDTALATENDFFFKTGAEMQSNRVFDRVPTPADAAPIAPPADCQAAKALKNFVIPRLADASIVVESEEELIYQTSSSVQAVRDFYLQELTALGWTLSDDTSLGSIASMTFTQGNQTISVTVLGAGSNTTVTVSKY